MTRLVIGVLTAWLLFTVVLITTLLTARAELADLRELRSIVCGPGDTPRPGALAICSRLTR
jgi:hypothetical protein